MAALGIVPGGRHSSGVHGVIVMPRVGGVKCGLGFQADGPIGSRG